MRLIFLTDFLGRETAMKQYHKDDVADIAFAQAQELVRMGVCREYTDAQPVKKSKRLERSVSDGGSYGENAR